VVLGVLSFIVETSECDEADEIADAKGDSDNYQHALASTFSPLRPLANRAEARRMSLWPGGNRRLCCAYELMRRGHEVTVLEAAGRTDT